MTDKEFLNLPIDSTFVLGNRTLKVVESDKCDYCYIGGDCDMFCERLMIPECKGKIREDKKDVIFVEVENESME